MYDLIPDEYKARTGQIVSLLVAVLFIASTWGDVGPVFVLWTGRAFGALVILSNVLGLKIVNPKAKP